MPVRLSTRSFRPARAALALAACWGLMGTASWADTPAPAETAAPQPASQEENAAAAPQAAQPEPAGPAPVSAAEAAAAELASAQAIKAAIKQSFDKRFPGLSVGEAVPTPFKGLYEVPVQGELFYVDATGRYVLQGSLIDLETRTDLTAERMA